MSEEQTLQKLHALRLSGMADSFENYMQFGPADKRTPAEVLAELTDAEWDTRINRRTERLLKKASLRLQATFEELTYSPERNLDRKVVHKLSGEEWLHNGSTVLITGATGAGNYVKCLVM